VLLASHQWSVKSHQPTRTPLPWVLAALSQEQGGPVSSAEMRRDEWGVRWQIQKSQNRGRLKSS